MNKSYGYIEIYSDILDLLGEGEYKKSDIFNFIIAKSGLSEAECKDTSLNGCRNTLRVKVGGILAEMEKKGVIAMNGKEEYIVAKEKPVALRQEMCEAEIISCLKNGKKSRSSIKAHLVKFFGTEKTKTKRDDNTLNSLITDSLKSLCKSGVLSYDEELYSISKKHESRLDDIHGIAAVKAEFLGTLHSRGGEFFEYFFMNLISKYLTSHGKFVRECSVTAGADDGGIDGIVLTTDSLGFRENIMIQTKNRNENTTEVDVRGFYGAVCARRGSRGIYAITSRFHPGAKKFLEELDDCIGLDGEDIFNIAKECMYGLTECDGKITVDDGII